MKSGLRAIAALAVVAVISSIVSVGVVLAAGPSFTDVPVDHPFYDEIEDVAGACVAGGFPDGGYRPGEPVTRQAMAAFLSRAMSRASDGSVSPGAPTSLGIPQAGVSSPLVDLMQVTITTPDLPGTCMIPVEVHGTVNLSTNNTRASSCHNITTCWIEVFLAQDDSTVELAATRLSADYWADSVSLSKVLEQQDGTTATYYLQVSTFNVQTMSVSAGNSLVASTHPAQAYAAP